MSLNQINGSSAQAYKLYHYQQHALLSCCLHWRQKRIFVANASIKFLFAKTHIHTTALAGLLDHDSPTAEGLSCDCTHQSDSWCVSTEKRRGLGISWLPTFSSKWLISWVILSRLLNWGGGCMSSETHDEANLSRSCRLLYSHLYSSITNVRLPVSLCCPHIFIFSFNQNLHWNTLSRGLETYHSPIRKLYLFCFLCLLCCGDKNWRVSFQTESNLTVFVCTSPVAYSLLLAQTRIFKWDHCHFNVYTKADCWQATDRENIIWHVKEKKKSLFNKLLALFKSI